MASGRGRRRNQALHGSPHGSAGGNDEGLGNPRITPELKQTVIDGVLREAAGRSVDQLAQEENEVIIGLLKLRAGDGASTEPRYRMTNLANSMGEPQDTVSRSAVLIVRRGPNAAPNFGWISRSHQQAAILAITSSPTTQPSAIAMPIPLQKRRIPDRRCGQSQRHVRQRGVGPFGCADQRRRHSDGEVPADVFGLASEVIESRLGQGHDIR